MVAAGLLAACGGESNTGDPAGGDAPSRRLAVPDGYDTSWCWEAELPGTHPRCRTPTRWPFRLRSRAGFDLQRGTGHCFEETDRDKPVHLTEVTDDGVAAGESVVVDVATGWVSESDHTAVPFSDYAGFGLFWDEEGEEGEAMFAYPHSE